MNPKFMQGADFKVLRAGWGLSAEGAARVLQLGEEHSGVGADCTVRRREAGDREIPSTVFVICVDRLMAVRKILGVG